MPQSLTLDLQSPAEISAVEQQFKDFDEYAFTIEVSADGRRWTVLADHSDGVRGQTFRVDADGSYRFVRFNCLRSKSGFWANSTDLRVIGSRDGQPPATQPASDAPRWWESTSGVMRYYAKYYGTTIREIIDELPSLRPRASA